MVKISGCVAVVGCPCASLGSLQNPQDLGMKRLKELLEETSEHGNMVAYTLHLCDSSPNNLKGEAMEKPIICEHGSLKRKCLVCELQEESAFFRKALEDIVKYVELTKQSPELSGAWQIAKKALDSM